MVTKNETRYAQFLKSRDTLRIYEGSKLIYSSQKERLMPLMDFISKQNPNSSNLVVFDRVIGNAAALLLTKIPCAEVYSPLGSEMAVKTLQDAGIDYHFNEVVDYIKDDSGQQMCPMEQLSQGKTAAEFYSLMLEKIKPDDTKERKI